MNDYDAVKRVTELHLAVTRASALLGMYAHSKDPAFLDQARSMLEQAEGEPVYKVPWGTGTKKSEMRQQRIYRQAYGDKKRSIDREIREDLLCVHGLPEDLCQGC